ncbi:uncharacterized protein LOC141619370 [Silene latifolia]|uniref:uncharacterized protein LOC141619370 n=1 Tax=Silene latifolia TaxID=37657 RepID=UPI003D780A3B
MWSNSLVIVGMDGNNNIYPIAWVVVEIENGETWCLFLRLLMEDLGMEAGLGITIMSDRRKGIREAFNVVTPKAHIKFCVRHIWVNFKVQFPGILFKEAFWKAARASTEVPLTGVDIHSTQAANQTFSEVGFGWANCCDVYASSDDSFEVEYMSKQYVVDLPSQNCSCGHWQLCGLPCQHAIAAIHHQRANYEDYVHQAYTKDKYLAAYGTPIPPMPRICQWESVGKVKPLPPPYRKFPGSHSLKKRRKEVGEGTSSEQAKRPRLQRTCGKCG